MSSGDLALWQALNNELTSMADTFTTFVRAARIPDDESNEGGAPGNRERNAPGELLEVLAEKLVFSGYMCLHHIAELKKGAAVGDVNTLIVNIRTVRDSLTAADTKTAAQLSSMSHDVQGMLARLEASYYESGNRGRLVRSDVSRELQQLCQVAIEAPPTRVDR